MDAQTINTQISTAYIMTSQTLSFKKVESYYYLVEGFSLTFSIDDLEVDKCIL